MMTKISRVIVTIYPPREDGYPGQVEEGYYLRKGNVVSLVSHAGVPVRRDGKTYSKALGRGEDPHQIAGRLLKELYQSQHKKNRFSGPIHYPRTSIV
jgi:hypothetical protein